MRNPAGSPDQKFAERIQWLKETPISPEHDPWDPLITGSWNGRPLLASIEVTVTNTCNLRCEHCAVGDLLTYREERHVSLDQILQRLDEVDSLVTFSVTGGEPTATQKLVDEVVVPLLKYAKGRGLRTQINTNLTQPLARYEAFAELVDVLHISYNYPDAAEFARIAYARAPEAHTRSDFAFRRLEENTRELARSGVFVSAETILTPATIPHIARIHERIVELGCRRHEIHPLYPSDFAASMQLPTLDQLADGVEALLDARDPDTWILFGTFPFFACSPEPRYRELYVRAHAEPCTTVRNDPDGRNRLNVSSLTGDVLLQDFADFAPLGNIMHDSFNEIWDRWLDSGARRRIACACDSAKCLGPNLIVAETYYPGLDWTTREALVAVP